MGLRDLFRGGGLRPAWTHTASGTLWRVIPAPPDTVVGEERDTGAKRATFFALDLRSGRLRWSGRRFHDDWWVGVSAVQRDVLLLHGFATPDMPGHLGVVAADVQSGDVLWSEPTCSLVELRTKTVVLSRSGPAGPVVEERTLRTGETAATDTGEAGHATRSDDGGDLQTPVLVDPTSGLDPRLAHLLRPVLPEAPSVGPLEVIEHRRALIAMSYERGASASDRARLNGRLWIMHPESGALLYEEVVQRELHMPVPNTFSVVHDMLLYVKEGRSLRAIPL